MKKIRRLTSLLLALLMLGSLSARAGAEETGEPAGKTELSINVDVGEEGCNSASYDLGQNHIWMIRSIVPPDIADAERYEITAVLDHRLTPEVDSVSVVFAPGNDEPVMLKAEEQYHISRRESTGGEAGSELIVTLTREGMAFLGKYSGFTEGELTVTYQASINSRCSVGESIPIMARIRYIAPSGEEYAAESDKPEVHTGGIVLKKTDAMGEPLAGAEFRIARPAVEGSTGEPLVLEEEIIYVEYPQFCTVVDGSPKNMTSVTTDETGMAEISGLAYGTYFIVEILAPEGYNLLTQPIAVIIDETSHLTEDDGWKDSDGNTVDNTVRIVNTKFVLPDTGGPGTAIYRITGYWIVLCSLILIVINRKRI